MRAIVALTLLLTSAGATARPAIFGPAAHYYGPLKIWHGVGFQDRVEKDGSWRIMAASRRIDGQDFARSMALYRAAELADTGGHPYIQILGGRIESGIGIANYGTQTVVVHIRASDSAAPPTACRQAVPRPGNCFTISVAQVRATAGAALGLAAPIAPSFAAEVDMPLVPPPSPLLARLPMPTPTTVSAPVDTVHPVGAERVIHGHDPVQGWSISD